MLCIIIEVQYDIISTYFYVSNTYPVITDAIIWCRIPTFCEQLNSTVSKAIYTKQENRLLGICLQFLIINMFLCTWGQYCQFMEDTFDSKKFSVLSHDTAHVARHALQTSHGRAGHYEDIMQISRIT